MTELSKKNLMDLLNKQTEKEIEDALSWAEIYEVKYIYTWTGKTQYMIASLVYLYETANERPNSIGKALCETIDDYDEDEAQKIMNRYRFPVISMYTVIKEWKRTYDVPIVFNLELIAKDYEVMHGAASRDDLDIIHWLFNHDIYVDIKDSFGKTALHVAAAGGKIRITRCLLAHGASIFSLDNEHQTPLEAALQRYKFETAEFLKPNLFCNLRMSDGETLLMRLIRDGDPPQVKYMLRYANFKMLNYSDQNILHVCAQSGQTKVMGALLRESIPSEMLNAKDAFNQTPLYLAIRQKKSVMVEQLLAAGAEITSAIKNMSTTKEITSLLKQYDPDRNSLNQHPH